MSSRGRPERGEHLGHALARALTGVSLGDRWIVEGLIGIGGMGVVLGATDGPDGAPVVAKVIAPQLAPAQWAAFVKASRREALALRRLSERRPPSPYIVRFFDEGEVEVQVAAKIRTGAFADEVIAVRYLILEYVDGEPQGTTLHERIHRSLRETNHGFPPARARRILRHIARALTDIHAERLIHRDLKPTNVLVCGPPGEDVAKVTDFGIVRVQDDASSSGVVAVSVGYSAPEQYVPGNTQVGPQSDLFSFGALAYEVLTGCALFPQEAQAALSAARRPARHSLLDAPTIHETFGRCLEQVAGLDKLIAQATWPKIEGRPHDVREFWKGLDTYLSAIEQIESQQLTSVPLSGRVSLSRSAELPALRAEMMAGAVHSAQGTQGVQPGGDSETTTAPRENEAWQWRIRGRDEGPDAVRDVAIGEDGRALAVGAAGVRYWDGGGWLEIPLPDGIPRDAFSCVARLDPDRYALGGREGLLAFLTRGNWQLLRGADPIVEYTSLWGNEHGVLIAAARRPGRSAVIWCAKNGAWLAPRKLPGVHVIRGLAPLGPGIACAVGEGTPREARTAEDRAGALLLISTQTGLVRDLRPADAELPRLLSVASSRFGDAVIIGAEGFAARLSVDPFAAAAAMAESVNRLETEIKPERVETRRDLQGARFDSASHLWAVAPGRILARSLAPDGKPVWRRIWWGSGDGPNLLRIHAGGDRLFAFGREGLVVEGRSTLRATRSERPPPR